MKRLLFIIIINLLFLNINSQEELRGDYPESIKNLYSRASFEIEVNRDYKKAEWYLNKLLKKRKEVPQAMQLLVRIYIFENDNTKALDYLKKLYKVAPNDFYNLYTYAKVLKNTGKYIQAKKLLGKMLVLAKDTLKGYEFEERYKPLVKNDLASINLSLDQIANPKNIIKTRLEGVNTKKNEYFPTLTVDQQTIMVTTKVASNKKLIDYRDNPQHEDIYVSKRVEGKWSELKSLSRKINTPLNEGAQTLSSDGRTLYFTSSGRKENLGSTDIYMSKKMPDGSWSLPQNLGVSVNSRYWDTQPSISSDGQTLFFISDRRGGVGKSDIWYCTKDKEGFWNPAKPLGRNINTRGVEYTPFVSFDGKTLYFASDGHPGMGGLDLFVSKKGDDGKWQKPVNMGYPINSFGQQVGLFVAADGETAYYADDSETNNSDIYTFKLPEDYQSEVTSFVKGRVFDEVYKTNLYSKIQLLDSKTKKIIVTTESDQKTGEYLITLPTGKMYTLYIEEKDYFRFSKNFFLKRKKNLENIINIPLKPSMASVNVACTVKDEDTKGAIQPVVLIRKADGRFFYETVPDQKGNVEFDLEPKNDYTIEVFMNGYKTLKRTLSVKNEKQLKFDYLMKQNPTIFRLQVFDKETKSEIQSNYVIKRAWRNIAKGETDEDGRFNVKLERNAKYGIEIRNISFPLFENTFTTDKDTIDYQVYLDNDKTKIVNSADKPELVKQQLNEDLAVKSEFIHKKDPIVIGQKAKKEQNLIVEKVVEDGSDLDPIVENIEDETKAKQLVTHNKTITEYKHDEKESEFKEDEVTQFNDNAEKSVFKDDVEKFESDEDQSKFKESNKEFNQDAESNKDLDKVVKKNEFEGIEIKFLDKKSNKLLPAEFKVSKKVKKTNLKSNQTNELGLVKLKSKPEDVYVLNANLDGYIPIKKEFKSSTVGSELILVMEKRHVQGVRKIIKKRKKENTKKKREARVAVQTYKQPENKIIQKPKKVEKPVVIENNSEFYFNFGGTGLDKSSIRKLIRVNKNANSYIIESHTDTVGTSRYNLFLSFRRAFAFKKTLIKLGVDPKKIKYKCMGEKEPKYRENYRNRRVELHIK